MTVQFQFCGLFGLRQPLNDFRYAYLQLRVIVHDRALWTRPVFLVRAKIRFRSTFWFVYCLEVSKMKFVFSKFFFLIQLSPTQTWNKSNYWRSKLILKVNLIKVNFLTHSRTLSFTLNSPDQATPASFRVGILFRLPKAIKNLDRKRML